MVGEHRQQIDNFINLFHFEVGALLANELLERVIVEEWEGIDAVATLYRVQKNIGFFE